MTFKAPQHLRWIVVLVVIVLCLVTIENIAAEKWEVISELPTQRSGFSTAVVEGKIYLIGGTLFEHERGVRRADLPGIWRGPFGISLVEVYDPETNSWRRLSDMPTARSDPKTAVVDGKIYVLAGFVGKDNRGENLKNLKVVEMYNPQTDTWLRKQDMPTPRIQFGIDVIAGKIYAIGGYVHPRDRKPGDPGRVDLVEVYDPATDMWVKRADMPTKRDGFGVEVVNNLIYAIGGSGWPQVGNGGPFLTTIEEYDPKVNRWRQKNEMPEFRLAFSTVVVKDRIYLIGGFIWQNRVPQYLSIVDTYNPETGEWGDIPAMPTPVIPFGAAVVNGNIYVFGGRGDDRENFTNVLVYGTGFHGVEAMGKLAMRWGKLKAEH